MKCDGFPRIAVDCNGKTRLGFLVSENRAGGFATVRFLKPQGWDDVEIPLSDILGICGKTFHSSYFSHPDICERVTFIDHGRQRKGWVWDIVEPDGKVVLSVGDEFFELWVEELITMPLESGWRKLSEGELGEHEEQENGSKSVLALEMSNSGVVNSVKKGGGIEKFAEEAARAVKRSRALLTELFPNKK